MGDTLHIDSVDTVIAPDGLQVRPMLQVAGGGMAEFQLSENLIGRAIRHHHIEEIWFVVAGSGQIWRDGVNGGEPVDLEPGACVSVLPKTAFQVRAGDRGLYVLAATMPPWPGDDEAEVLEGVGPWVPTL